MSEALFEILRGFRLDAEPVSCEPYGCGHINTTYLAVTASGRRYILQKINHHTFRDVAGLMDRTGELITDLTAARAKALQGDGTISGGMIPKVECCLSALADGVDMVTIVDGRVENCILLELLTDRGIGTALTL